MERERYLKQLLDVIRVLRSPEAELAKKHLIAYETNHTVNYQKMFKLYKYIKINEIENYEKLKQKISPDSTDDSFNKLIRRTTDRIQESLIIDVNIHRKDAYNDVFRTKFFLIKKIIQAQILIGRGLSSVPLKILNNVIKLGNTFELYEQELEALRLKQIVVLNTRGIEASNKLYKKIELLEKSVLYLNESKKVHRLFEINFIQKSTTSEIDKELVEKVEKLKDYYEEIKSDNILSYYLLMQIDIAKSNLDIDQGLKHTKQLLKLVQSSKVLYSVNRILYLYNEAATLYINKIQFVKAQSLINEVFVMDLKDSFTLIDLKVLKFKLDLLLNENVDLLTEIEEVLSSTIIEKYPYLVSRLNYQKAIFNFINGRFKEASLLFSQKNEIEKDKEGWNVWIRIMRLMCSIELLKLDMIDYDVESFRKYLQRIDKKYDVRERDKLILSVLLELDRQDYDFQQTAIEKKKELALLKSTNKKYKWNPDSPELILFHDWFEAKRLKKAYSPNFEVYRN